VSAFSEAELAIWALDGAWADSPRSVRMARRTSSQSDGATRRPNARSFDSPSRATPDESREAPRPRTLRRAPRPQACPGAHLLKDRGHIGIGEQVPVALLIPVENYPDPVVLIGIAKDVRALGPVLLFRRNAIPILTTDRSRRNIAPACPTSAA
jgi:hypothetical protein